MNHKNDRYFLATGLLLPSVVNILYFVFHVDLPHWTEISAIALGIAAMGIYVVRVRKIHYQQ